MPTVGVVTVDVRGNTVAFDRDIKKAAAEAERTLRGIASSSASAAFRTIAGAAVGAAAAVGGVGIAAVRASTDFNKAMSGVAAVANATEADLQRLRTAALDAGADTAFSATQAADALAELARAGVSVNDILSGGLNGTLALAAAGQLDLAQAATITAQALNVFDLAGDQTTRVADVLAAGANKSAADVGQLGDALRQGGLVADQLGLSVEDTVGVLSLFADNALIGSDAGTSFKTMLQRLVPQSEEQAKAMESLGLSFFDAQGNFVGIEETAGRLQNAFGGLTEEQRASEFATIFGSDAVRAATLLYEAGATGVAEYTAAVDDQGAASRAAATQLDNLAGDFEAFKGSVETALIGLGDFFDPLLRSVTQGSTEVVNSLGDIVNSPSFAAVRRNMEALGNDIEAVFVEASQAIERTLGTITSQDIDRFFRGVETQSNRARVALDGIEGAAIGAAIGLGSMALKSTVIGGLVPAINPVAAAIAGIVLQSDEGRESLGDLFEVLGESAGVIGESLTGALQDLSPEIVEVVEAFTDLAVEVLPIITDLFSDVAEVAGPLVADGLGLVADAVGFIADNSEVAVPVIAGLATVLKFQAISSGVATLSGVATKIRDVGIAAQLTVQNRGGLNDFIGLLGGGGISAAAGIAGAAVVGLTAAWMDQRQRAEEATASAERYRDAIAESGSAVSGAADEFGRWLSEGDDEQIDAIRDAMIELGLSVPDVADAFVRGARSVDELVERMIEVQRETEAARLGYESWVDLLKDSETIDLGEFFSFGDDANQDIIRLGEARRSSDDFAESLRGQFDQFIRGAALQAEDTALKGDAITTTERLTGAIDALTAAQERNQGRAKNVADAEIRVADATERLAEARKAEGGAAGADTSGTKAQRDTLKAIRDSVQANVDLALAQQATGASAEDTALRLVAQREALAALKGEGVLTEDAYASLLAQFALTPDEIITTVNAQGVEVAKEDVDDLQRRMQAIDDAEFTSQITTLIEEPTPQNMAAARALVDEYYRRNPVKIRGTVTITPNAGLFGILPSVAVARADGGFGLGGLPRDAVIQAPVQSGYPGGGLIQWAEPSTDGEAFIPMGSTKRDKALPVLDEVARRFGLALVPPDRLAPAMRFADGGFLDIAAFGGPTASDLTRFVMALNGSDPRRYQYQDTSATPGVGRWWDTETGRVLGYAKSERSEVYRTASDAKASSGEAIDLSTADATPVEPTALEGGGEGSTRDMDPMLRQFFEALAPKEQQGLPDLRPILERQNVLLEQMSGNLSRPNNYTVGRIEGSQARQMLADVLADDRERFKAAY